MDTLLGILLLTGIVAGVGTFSAVIAGVFLRISLKTAGIKKNNVEEVIKHLKNK